jgi:hypothetical protein
MTEIPDEDQTRRDGQEARGAAAADDPARGTEPGLGEPGSSETAREAGTGDQP